MEKPLHVRVAEALGWSAFESKHGYFIVTHGSGVADIGTRCEYGFGRARALYDSETGTKLPPRVWWEDCPHVPAFDTDWCATGPLIEKLDLSVRRSFMPKDRTRPYTAWADASDVVTDCAGHGETHLVAVCRLILALHAAGKLPR